MPVIRESMPKSRVSLARYVQQEVLDYIVEQGLREGDQLPTETELCEMLGVSRTALREGMKYLEILGVVSVERGRGTFLRTFDVGVLLSNLPMQLLFRPRDILEVVRVRQTLEEFCLEQAIVRSSDEEIEELGKYVDAMRERAERGEPMEAEDIAFHRQIARMADTRLLLTILEIFWALRRKYATRNDPVSLRQRYLRHYRLYQAIRRRDLQMARLYLAEHFFGSYEELEMDVARLEGLERGRRSQARSGAEDTGELPRPERRAEVGGET
jgi:DNA-binding FadR family transcriptional regulator